MRGIFNVNGFVNRGISGGEMRMERKDLIVNVTKDSIGCTISIGSEEDDIQMSIPFDGILKELNRR